MTKAKKPWRKKAKKFYRLQDSPLYKLQSKKKLAKLLFTSVTALRGMTDKSVPHYEYWEEKRPMDQRDRCVVLMKASIKHKAASLISWLVSKHLTMCMPRSLRKPMSLMQLHIEVPEPSV